MKITVLYFHTLRDKTGAGGETLEIDEGCTVEAAIGAVLSRHPSLVPFRASLLSAVNEEWCPPDHRLNAGDTLALMPPVSGG